MGKFFRGLLVVLALFAIWVVIGRLLFPLPDISDRAESSHIGISDSTTIGRLTTDRMQAHPGKSGVLSLENGRDALASRLALIDAAEQSIDVQYYIWHDDVSGTLLLDALHRAAQRGVRVRLLLDDNGIHGLDPYLSALDTQENFHVRLFNPSTIRAPKLLGYTLDFFRMNRRMHNKSLTVDGAAVIVGGRNIGDEYFISGDDAFFVDLDVLAAGPIAQDTAAVFDRYWNSGSVYAIDTIVSEAGDIAAFEAHVAEMRDDPDAGKLQAETRASALRMFEDPAQLEWTEMTLVADDPIKGLGKAEDSGLMIFQLGKILGGVGSTLDLVSAYFIPGQAGADWLADLSSDGVQVRVLTNALDTTDVIAVHSGYTKYRRDLLTAGVALFEFKLAGDAARAEHSTLPLGLSGASLHAKTFAVDRSKIFVGSFNFDPRSARLNCEMGILIQSPSMAERVSSAFDTSLAAVSYQPDLTPGGKMVWIEDKGSGDPVIYQQEPGASWLQQVTLTILGLLPIEWML